MKLSRSMSALLILLNTMPDPSLAAPQVYSNITNPESALHSVSVRTKVQLEELAGFGNAATTTLIERIQKRTADLTGGLTPAKVKETTTKQTKTKQTTSKQTTAKHTDTKQTAAKHTNSKQTTAKHTNTKQTDTERTDTTKTNSKQTNIRQTTKKQTNTKQTTTKQAPPKQTVDDFQMCNYSASYDSLDDLNMAITGGSNSAHGTLRSDCVAFYALSTLIQMLDTAYHKYTVVNDGYNKEFGYYVTYMKKAVPEILDNSFMFNTTGESDTARIPPLGPGMKYFECKISTSGGSSFPCSKIMLGTHVVDMAGHKTSLTLKNKDGYNAALTKAGITPDWVHFGDHTITKDLITGYSGNNYEYQFSGYPIEKSNMVVPNPKDIVTKALPNIPNLLLEMKATLLDIMMGNWVNGSTADAAKAYSTPVFMLMQAVEGMEHAKALGQKEQKEEEEAKRKNLIITIVSVVLLFVPVIGEEAATAAGLATLARAIAIAGEVGNAALGIYDTVQDPSSAFVNVLGLLIGVGAIAKVSRDGPGLAKVARAQEKMSTHTIANLGTIFKSNSDKLESTMKFCKWN